MRILVVCLNGGGAIYGNSQKPDTIAPHLTAANFKQLRGEFTNESCSELLVVFRDEQHGEYEVRFLTFDV